MTRTQLSSFARLPIAHGQCSVEKGDQMRSAAPQTRGCQPTAVLRRQQHPSYDVNARTGLDLQANTGDLIGITEA